MATACGYTDMCNLLRKEYVIELMPPTSAKQEVGSLKGMCPLGCFCALTLAHAAKKHLPWYAGLQYKMPVGADGPNVTVLCLQITRMIPLHKGKVLSRAMLQVIGKLLYDMLDFIIRFLKLSETRRVTRLRTSTEVV